MRIDDAETPGFTITFRYEGCDTALPYEFVDIDTHGLLFRFDRQPDPERELVPLDLVFAEVYGTVFQAGTFVATGFDAFEIQVPAIPEPSPRVLLAGGLLVVLVARRFRGGPGFS